LNLEYRFPAPNRLVHLQGADAAQFISLHLWSTSQPFSGSSSSYFMFDNDPTTCASADTWAVNHTVFTGGSHVRFWQNGADWTDVRAAAHHEQFACLGHHVDDFNGPRDQLAAFFAAYTDIYGRHPFKVVYTRPNPVRTWNKGCGFTAADDGRVANVIQDPGIPVVETTL
jgi:hypothetical protein